MIKNYLTLKYDLRECPGLRDLTFACCNYPDWSQDAGHTCRAAEVKACEGYDAPAFDWPGNIEACEGNKKLHHFAARASCHWDTLMSIECRRCQWRWAELFVVVVASGNQVLIFSHSQEVDCGACRVPKHAFKSKCIRL